MTLVLDLAPDIEAKLQQQAAQLGVTIPALITRLVEDTAAISMKNGENEDAGGIPGQYTQNLAGECHNAAQTEQLYGIEALLKTAQEIRAATPKEEQAKSPGDWAINPDKYRFAGMFPGRKGDQ